MCKHSLVFLLVIVYFFVYISKKRSIFLARVTPVLLHLSCAIWFSNSKNKTGKKKHKMINLSIFSKKSKKSSEINTIDFFISSNTCKDNNEVTTVDWLISARKIEAWTKQKQTKRERHKDRNASMNLFFCSSLAWFVVCSSSLTPSSFVWNLNSHTYLFVSDVGRCFTSPRE